MENTKSVLKHALDTDSPVIIIYEGKDGISQRRVFVRKLNETGIMAYCTLKKAVRMFKYENILSAVMGE